MEDCNGSGAAGGGRRRRVSNGSDSGRWRGHLQSRCRGWSLTAEIERLKKEVAKLKMERDILKKAAAYFAKDSL